MGRFYNVNGKQMYGEHVTRIVSATGAWAAGARSPRSVQGFRGKYRERHDFTDDKAIRTIQERARHAVVAMVWVTPEACHVVDIAAVREGTERASAAYSVNGIGTRPAAESRRVRPTVGEQMIGAVGSSDDAAVPVVVSWRNPSTFGSFDPVTRVARKYARDAPSSRTEW